MANDSHSDIFEFERIDECTLCGSTSQHDAKGASWFGVGFSYCICNGCGMKYMRPRPTTESYERFYKDQYWQQNMQGAGYASANEYNDTEQDQLKLRMPKYEKAYRIVKEHLLETCKVDKDLRVLEVGCAFGFTLEWLNKDFGCKVYGLEPSSEAIARCESAGVPIVARTAEEMFLNPGTVPADKKYDVILLRHVLDTLSKPVEVMKGIREYLADGGLLLIHSVNVEFYDAMDPYHPFLYSPDTARRLMALAGFDVFRLDASPSPVDHEVAVGITKPSYQQAIFARRGDPRRLPLPNTTALEVMATHERGKQVMAWAELNAKDLVRRLALKSAEKSKRVFESAAPPTFRTKNA